jgi:hypothetical protein
MAGELLNTVNGLAGLESTSDRTVSKVVRCEWSTEVRFFAKFGDHSVSLKAVKRFTVLSAKQHTTAILGEHFLKQSKRLRGERYKVRAATFRGHL